MLVLYNPGVGHFPFRVVYHRIALVILQIKDLLLKTNHSVFQHAKRIVEIPVNLSRINHLFRHGTKAFPVGKIIHAKPHFHTGKHFLDHLCVASDGNSLVTVIKIIVVIGKPQRKPLDNKGRKLPAASPPLLLRIALHQLLINITPD